MSQKTPSALAKAQGFHLANALPGDKKELQATKVCMLVVFSLL
jgi:hypothetical protein